MSIPPPDEERGRVRRVLEERVREIDSPEKAEEVIRQLEQLAAGHTEQEKGQQAAAKPASAATCVEDAATDASPPEAAAAVLAETAAQAVAPTEEAPVVLEAAQEVLAAPPTAIPPDEDAGRSLLRQAVLRRMGFVQAIDARIYMAINGVDHPRWLDRTANAITLITTGGWIWLGGALAAQLFGATDGKRAVRELFPSLVGATWIVEHPMKAYFRRQRPFIDIVRALVIGKKPGSWSFPSGHTAASFASAWVLSTVWPRWAPLFFALASSVGFSRVYVGAHYPGDVLAGAFLGMTFAELIREAVRALRAVTRS